MTSETAIPHPQIAGYRIEKLLGHGGMADVFLATQLSLGRPVAIKVLAAERTRGEDTVSRFENEARTIARLVHPHIVSIFDVGRTADQRLYYTMPYLPHGDLAARKLRGNEPVIAAILRALCDALAYAHSQGIVHRDVKPGNVLFDALDRPLLGDFGIALSASAYETVRITREGSTIGSSGYMSPEQARGATLDGRADLYSLGIVAYEQLSGDLPFHGVDTLSMALAHVEQPIPRLPAALRHWQGFIDTAMAKNPAQRFQSAAQMRAALDAIKLTPNAAAARKSRTHFRVAAAFAAMLIGGAMLVLSIKPRTQGAVAQASLAPAAPAPVEAAPVSVATNAPALPPVETATHEEPLPITESVAPQKLRDEPEFATVVVAHDGKPGYALMRYEVTRGDYQAFARATARAVSACLQPMQPLSRLKKLSWRDPGFAQEARHPVVCVSWHDATAYAHWLSERTGATYRLPTRAEWLQAARTASRADTCAQGNLGGHRTLPFRIHSGGCKNGSEQTVPVGRYKANALGIYDLVGNASEWVEDCQRNTNSRCTQRLFVGTSWRDDAESNTLEATGNADEDVGYTTVGFRLLRKLDAENPQAATR